jgi:hypothetical protein
MEYRLSARLSLRPAKTELQNQQEPNRLIGEVKEMEGFARKIEDGRQPDFRLANRLTRLSGSLRFGASRLVSWFHLGKICATNLSNVSSSVCPPTNPRAILRYSSQGD